MSARKELYLAMVALRESIKLLHFQTTKHSVHVTSDAFLTDYDALFDAFWEVLQSNGMRVRLSGGGSTITLKNQSTPSTVLALMKRVEELLNRVKLPAGAAVSADNLFEAFERFRYLLSFE